jgi:hypothetical protein
MHDGLHSQLKLLRSDCAEKIGSGPAPRNSASRLRPLRSNMHGEHETKRYAPGPEPVFSAVTQNRPPPGTACREGTLRVFDLGCAVALASTLANLSSVTICPLSPPGERDGEWGFM